MASIKVTLTPAWDGTAIPSLKVYMETDIPAKQNEDYFRINRKTIFKDFVKLDGTFQLSDSKGTLATNIKTEHESPVILEKYAPTRDSEGMVCLQYTCMLSPCGINPTFDLGFEDGGMTGAGMTFMPAFLTEGKIEYTLTWDLSALPERSVGAWSFGEGTVHRVGQADTLMTTFYAAGLMDSVRMGKFSYYWFPNAKIPETALATSRIFDYESRFFQDPGDVYTIFARHTEDPGTTRAGGTALTRSYMFVYLNDEQISSSWLIFLFAHEMVHNWIHLKDEPFGTCTWYVEGMAEYYSALLPLRMGIVSASELAEELNKRAKQYYENPMIHCTNAECGAELMMDPEKTRIPYGRGFFYLTHADSMIRKATHGQKCLDDVTLQLNRAFEENHDLQNEAWFKAYGQYVGEDVAKAEYEHFRDGGIVEPAVDCYEGKICVTKAQGTMRESQIACELYVFEAVDAC